MWAQAQSASPSRIDVHAHYAPPAWVRVIDAEKSRGVFGNADIVGAFKDWTPSKSIEQMDRAGVATSIVSITTPGVWFGAKESPVEATRQLARQCNDYGARMAADFPGRFGLFATLPLPDVDGSLREIEYALDTLKADGFGLLTHYSEIYGEKLLGDPAFTPVFEELNRRKAIVYVHRKISTEPNEIFGWDVHRSILSLLKSTGTSIRAQSGYAPRYPDTRFIFCDAGGTMPFLIERGIAPTKAAGIPAAAADSSLLNELRKFHYGTGRSNNVGTMTTLKRIMPVSQILFETDYPFAQVADEAKGLQECGVFNAEELRAIYRENALTLFPKYRA